MVFHVRRILVTDIGNDENDHLRFDHPDRRTYTVYSHAFLQKSKIQSFARLRSPTTLSLSSEQNISCLSNLNETYDDFILDYLQLTT